MLDFFCFCFFLLCYMRTEHHTTLQSTHHHMNMYMYMDTCAPVPYLRNSFSGQLPSNITHIAADRVIEIYVMLSLYPVVYDVSSHCAVCPVRHSNNWPCAVSTKIWKRESHVSSVIYRCVTSLFVSFYSFGRPFIRPSIHPFIHSFYFPLHFGFGFICICVFYIVYESNTETHQFLTRARSLTHYDLLSLDVKNLISISLLDILAHQFER